MNILKEFDHITTQIVASHIRLARKLGRKAAWEVIKAYLDAYIASRDKLVEKGAI
jgi:hypothetical protein